MAMKKMKMKTAMKAGMKRRRAMKKSTVARGKRAHYSVFRGTKLTTTGGLKKGDFKKNKKGKIVSKKASDAAKNRKSSKAIVKWSAAFKQARQRLNIKGFVACTKGSALYIETQKIYKKYK